MNEIKITVEGPVGSGKSALLGEIEILCKALGVPVRYANPSDANSEKAMTHADWTAYLEMYKPSVVLHEKGPARAAPANAPIADPTDPGRDVDTLREHVRHLERRVQQLSSSAPVEDSTLPLEKALHELVSKIAPGLDTGDLLKDAQRASSMLDAPVADQQVAQWNEGFSSLSLWWTMIEAEAELAGEPIKDDAPILHFKGCGTSHQVTAGDIRAALFSVAKIPHHLRPVRR